MKHSIIVILLCFCTMVYADEVTEDRFEIKFEERYDSNNLKTLRFQILKDSKTGAEYLLYGRSIVKLEEKNEECKICGITNAHIVGCPNDPSKPR